MDRLITPLMFVVAGLALSNWGYERQHYSAVPVERQRRFGPAFLIGAIWTAIGVAALVYEFLQW